MLVSSGLIVAELFFMHEGRRTSNYQSFDAMEEALEMYGAKFRDTNLEMYFKAELGMLNRRYGTLDFDMLCYQCIDFSNIHNLPDDEIDDCRRYVNSIKCVGEPLWKKGIGKMLSWADYRRYNK